MKSLGGLLLLAFVLGVPAAWADEVFQNVQYVSGRAGFAKKAKGTLTLTETELKFVGQEGSPIISIPITEIKEVSNSVENNPGSTGAKIMLGVFASKKEEFVYVNTETKDAAEALVFKVKNKTSPAIVAKVRFQLKKANGATSTVPDGKSAAAPPEPAPVKSAPEGTAAAPTGGDTGAAPAAANSSVGDSASTK